MNGRRDAGRRDAGRARAGVCRAARGEPMHPPDGADERPREAAGTMAVVIGRMPRSDFITRMQTWHYATLLTIGQITPSQRGKGGESKTRNLNLNDPSETPTEPSSYPSW